MRNKPIDHLHTVLQKQNNNDYWKLCFPCLLSWGMWLALMARGIMYLHSEPGLTDVKWSSTIHINGDQHFSGGMEASQTSGSWIDKLSNIFSVVLTILHPHWAQLSRPLVPLQLLCAPPEAQKELITDSFCVMCNAGWGLTTPFLGNTEQSHFSAPREKQKHTYKLEIHKRLSHMVTKVPLMPKKKKKKNKDTENTTSKEHRWLITCTKKMTVKLLLPHATNKLGGCK